MDNFSTDSKNGGHTPPAAKRSKADQRWTLLFIGNHGKTITFKRFKGIVMLSCLVLAVSIAIIVGLLYFSFNVHHEKSGLQADLQDLKAQVKALRYEKDVLMTKLVLAESRSKPAAAEKKTGSAVSETPPDNAIDSEPVEQPVRVAASQKEQPAEQKANSPGAETVSDSDMSVDVESFRVIPKRDENLLRIQFKIKNTTANSQKVSGHAIVVLKADPLQQARWLTIPRMALTNGKPTGRQRGYSFAINHFKTMRFKTNLPKSPEIYRDATVYVFTRNGNLLLEKEFQVSLAPVQPAGAAAPASTTPSASAPTTPSKTPATSATTQPAKPGSAMPSTDELMNSLKNSASE